MNPIVFLEENGKIPLPEKITNIMAHLISNGFKAYVVGGAIRDFFMDITPHDYDIFTDAQGDMIKQLFPEGHIIGGEERQEKILTVIVDGVEVSSYRVSGDRTATKVGATILEHQKTCDFTINAIACDINGNIDMNNKINAQGLADLSSNMLRFVGDIEERIKEDELRVLRGIRFLLKYNMLCDKQTYEILTTRNINVPKERIRDELMKILSLKLYSGFLKYFLRFMPKSMAHSNNLLSGGNWHAETPYKHFEDSFLEMSNITKNPLLRMVALTHDNGKSDTRTEEEGVVHFYEHQKVGAENMRKWMNDHKFSNDEINYVVTFIYNHMHGYSEEEPSKKSYLKLFAALDGANISIEEYVMQLYADNQGNSAKERMLFGDFIKNNIYIKKYYEMKFTKEPFTIKDLAISGKDLIEKYGMVEGKEIGETLKEIFDLVQEGNLRNTKPDILYYIKTMKKYEVLK